MPYMITLLIIIIIVLAARLSLLSRALRDASKQMKEIEKNPDSNRQLKALVPGRDLEELLQKINQVYQVRQQGRILYQRRETQLRREIENISHDLRTPLTSILGYVELIKDKQISDSEKEEYLSIIHKRARVLQSFIQDFYELSRMEGDHNPLVLEVIDVQPILGEVIVSYYQEFEKRQVQVEISLEERNCSIIADRIQFHRILNNLIQNAFKYGEKSFILKQYTSGDECIIEVINDTKQLKEEELNFIFDRFYTGDTSRTNHSTGLGLTIAKQLVERMQGTVNARLKGDKFVLELRWKLT